MFDARGRLQHLARRVAPMSPLPLALLRIVLAALIFFSPEPEVARNLAQHLVNGSEALLFAPEGLSFMPAVLRVCAPYLDVIHWTLRIAAVTAGLGFCTRGSLALLLATSFVLFGAAQLSGTVTHDMHLLWMLVLLLAGPGSHGLSVDAWLSKQPLLHRDPSRRATFALWGARLMLGLVYLFPGIAKLRVSGMQWAFSDNLINQMRLKWFMAGGRVPWPRIDQWPEFVHWAGVSVIAFELGFVCLIWFRRGKRVAVALGLLFHWAMAHFLYVHFVGLWGCYVVFWDGPALRSQPLPPLAGDKPWLPLLAVAALVVPATIQGARGQTQSWPFACYPDFAHRPASHITDLAVDVQLSDGAWRTLRLPRRRAPREWGSVWKVLGLYGEKPDRSALDAYARRWLLRAPFRESVSRPTPVRFFAEEYSIVPEEYGYEPVRRRLVSHGALL